MNRRRLFIFLLLTLTMTALAGVDAALAGPGTLATDAAATPSGGTFYANTPAGTWSYMDAGGVTSLVSSNSGTPLRKFIDKLPGLGAANANLLGQYIPIATPDTGAFSGSDYYEIGLRDYAAKMHSDLPKATRLRGYYQKNGTDHSSQYLGPVIIAHKDRPVRIKFFDELGVNGAGDLFIPVDTTYMGAGMGPDGVNSYTQNRAALHLHGGHTPWISDGTPHQWITPNGETSTTYLKGDSQQNVPDMDGGAEPAGVETLYWTNNQSGRLMFYHDHAYGITRLNVYAGEAAGYLIVDPTEDQLINNGTIPGASMPAEYRYGIPLIIQDKTFVPADVAVQDAKWTDPRWGTYGDLWFPHVYETNQWPSAPDMSGANNFGRWDFGPWFWPPQDSSTLKSGDVMTWNASGVPEGFMDTPIINGTAYPYLDVQPTAYRFRILNAANDRMWNLQLYTADTGSGAYLSPTAGPTEVKMVDAVPRPDCSASVTTNCTCAPPTYAPAGCFPASWPQDSRVGGVPDPANMGPSFIQIGNESGLLPQAVVLPNQPVDYEYNRRNIVVLNVTSKTLFLGPAERADVIIDFSQFAGKTVILYNDAPAPVPAFDPRNDYYTGDPDNTWMGGAASTAPGYGPNTRTIMQFRVANTAPSAAFSVAGLQAAMPAAYVQSQPAPVVPQSVFPSPYNAATDTYSRIQDTSLTFTSLATGSTVTVSMQAKAIQELFTLDYGRMNATLGTELPFTNFLTQTTIPLGYIDPPTEILADGTPQIWKITHNGVDTHAIHFHLFDVQVINRVGWDGAIRPPDANEAGWKDVVRMHPLEDIIVALRPTKAPVPFPVPDSVRPLDPTMPLGTTTQFTGIDPYTNNPITVTNDMTNFGWEYVWHCHLLGHEENDMMRPIVFQVPPDAPTNLAASVGGPGVNLTWTDNAASETGFTVQRDTLSDFSTATTFTVPASVPNTSYGTTIAATDVVGPGTYYYRVQASSSNGISAWSDTATTSGAPFASLSPASLGFGNELISTASGTQTVTLSNTGTALMTISSIAIAGGNFAQTNNCGPTLGVGASCSIGVTFTPTAMGSLAASLTIGSDATNSPVTVLLYGTGIGPIIGVAPTTLLFGSQVINTLSTAQTVTISNTGTAMLTNLNVSLAGANPGDFSQSHNCGTLLSPGLNCVITVTFKPAAAGSRNATMTVISSDPVNPSIPVTLSGTGIAQPAAGVTPPSLTFSAQPLNTTSAAQTVTVSNTGSAAMTASISIAGANPGDFAQTNTCGTGVAIGGTCTVSVTFRPTTTGARAANLMVSTNDPANPTLAVSMTGLGTAIRITPASLAFGSLLVGATSAVQAVTMSNIGSTAVSISGIAITGPNAGSFTSGFSTTCGASLAAGRTCTISVRFKPLAPGTMTAAITVNGSDPASPQSVPLSGTGLARIAAVSPTALSFGTVTRGQASAPQTVTVSNTGNAPLTFNSVSGFALGGTYASQFTLATSGSCVKGGTLAAGASCTVAVTFAPKSNTAAGGKTATLFIRDNGTNSSTQTVSLSGTAQ